MSALIGRERLLQLYQHAITAGYRFYSYGDAMWIPPVATGNHKKAPATAGWTARLLNQAAAKLAATKSQFTSFSR